MQKIKLTCLLLPLLLLILPAAGCQYWDNMTNSGSGSSSNSNSSSTTTTTTQADQPAHGPATVNLMEQSPFNGQNLDPAYWSKLEGYCKAGPTQLVIADLNAVPGQMGRAGFNGRWGAQIYALASTVAGMNWSPVDGETQVLSNQRGQIDSWWGRYLQAVVQVMQKAPQTTAVVITNDGFDRLGFRLGPPTYRAMGSVGGRVQMGSIFPESAYN
jgi:hypothetical protein